MRDTPKLSRRQMLMAASVTAGATAARSAHAEAAPRTTPHPVDKRDVNLPDTEHVRTYYALARR